MQVAYLVHAEEHLQLYRQVSVPVLDEPQLICRILLPQFASLEVPVQQHLLHYIMSRWHQLQADEALKQALAATAFVPVLCSGGPIAAPIRLTRLLVCANLCLL